MQAPTYNYATWYAPTLASDSDREGTVEVLRRHWLDGRLTLDELEFRSAQALNARYVSDLWWAVRELPTAVAVAARPVVAAEPQHGSAVASVVLSSIGLVTFFMTAGLFAFITLPLSATGWLVGRSARRAAGPTGRGRSAAITGEVLGIVGTVCALLVVAACAAVFA